MHCSAFFTNNNTTRSLFYLFCFFVYLVASINKLELEVNKYYFTFAALLRELLRESLYLATPQRLIFSLAEFRFILLRCSASAAYIIRLNAK